MAMSIYVLWYLFEIASMIDSLLEVCDVLVGGLSDLRKNEQFAVRLTLFP